MSRVAVNPASQNWPRDRRGYCRAGKISHLRADMGSWGNESRAVCVYTMVSPLGMSKRFPPYRIGTLSLHEKVVGTEMDSTARVRYS